MCSIHVSLVTKGNWVSFSYSLTLQLDQKRYHLRALQELLLSRQVPMPFLCGCGCGILTLTVSYALSDYLILVYNLTVTPSPPLDCLYCCLHYDAAAYLSLLPRRCSSLHLPLVLWTTFQKGGVFIVWMHHAVVFDCPS